MSDSEKLEQIARLLEEVRDNQRTQLERQGEALAIQKEQFQTYLKQQEKAGQLQDRAEAIQVRSSNLIKGIQRFVPVVMVAVKRVAEPTRVGELLAADRPTMGTSWTVTTATRSFASS